MNIPIIYFKILKVELLVKTFWFSYQKYFMNFIRKSPNKWQQGSDAEPGIWTEYIQNLNIMYLFIFCGNKRYLTGIFSDTRIIKDFL